MKKLNNVKSLHQTLKSLTYQFSSNFVFSLLNFPYFQGNLSTLKLQVRKRKWYQQTCGHPMQSSLKTDSLTSGPVWKILSTMSNTNQVQEWPNKNNGNSGFRHNCLFCHAFRSSRDNKTFVKGGFGVFFFSKYWLFMKKKKCFKKVTILVFGVHENQITYVFATIKFHSIAISQTTAFKKKIL